MRKIPILDVALIVDIIIVVSNMYIVADRGGCLFNKIAIFMGTIGVILLLKLKLNKIKY